MTLASIPKTAAERVRKSHNKLEARLKIPLKEVWRA